MELKYNVTGARRKELVSAIAEITGADKEYLGAPTFAYRVDYFTIDKNGNVTFDDRADSEEIETLIDRLSDMGFEAKDAENSGLTVEMPSDKVRVDNLKESRAYQKYCRKAALGRQSLCKRNLFRKDR